MLNRVGGLMVCQCSKLFRQQALELMLLPLLQLHLFAVCDLLCTCTGFRSTFLFI